MPLLNALRTVSRTESSPIREEVFRDIASRSPLIRLVLALHRLCRALGISHLLVAGYGLSYYLRAALPSARVRWLGIALYPNEVKQLDDLDAIMGEGWQVSRVGWRLAHMQGALAFFSMFNWRDARRVLRLARRIDGQHRFMPACRVVVMLFLYLRLRPWLAQMRPRAVVATSDYSPDGAALAAAAGSLGIARVYMPHALPSMLIGGRTLLAYEAYVFDSEAMHARFAAMARLGGNVAYRGVRGAHAPLRPSGLSSPHPRIGIFLSGMTDMKALKHVLGALEKLSPASILVRGHPVDFANPDFSGLAQMSRLVAISSGTTLEEDAQSCDVILAGNTTAILETLRMGAPTLYYAKLDTIPYDYNGFVAEGLVPDVADIDSLDLRGMQAFFDSGWEARMCYFDAAYGQDAGLVRAQVRQALLALMEAA